MGEQPKKKRNFRAAFFFLSIIQILIGGLFLYEDLFVSWPSGLSLIFLIPSALLVVFGIIIAALAFGMD